MTIMEFLADRQLWNHRLSRWRALNAICEADIEFGDTARRNEAWQAERHRIANLPGLEVAQRKAMISAGLKTVNEQDAARYHAFSEPAELAAVDLVMTPAPDFDAILSKIEAIRTHELDNTNQMPREPMDILLEDLHRLDGGE